MRAATQRIGIEPRAVEHGGGKMRVPLGAGVRAAGERNLRRPEAEAISRARLDQRQRLQRLHRRARIDRPVDIAQAQRQSA